MNKQLQLEHKLRQACKRLKQEAEDTHGVYGFVTDADAQCRSLQGMEYVAHVRGLLKLVKRIHEFDDELLEEIEEIVGDYVALMHFNPRTLELVANCWQETRLRPVTTDGVLVLTQAVSWPH